MKQVSFKTDANSTCKVTPPDTTTKTYNSRQCAACTTPPLNKKVNLKAVPGGQTPLHSARQAEKRTYYSSPDRPNVHAPARGFAAIKVCFTRTKRRPLAGAGSTITNQSTGYWLKPRRF